MPAKHLPIWINIDALSMFIICQEFYHRVIALQVCFAIYHNMIIPPAGCNLDVSRLFEQD